MKTNILSLDGGGTWAIIQARALGAIYGAATPGHKILERFDYAFATSGGSLVLGGLMIDLSPQQIEAYFTDQGQLNGMFPSAGILNRLLRFADFGPRYSTAAKFKHLSKVFKGAAFESIRHATGRTTHCVIVAFDYARSRSFFFRSDPASRFPTVINATIEQAVHASTTAPVLYYDKPAEMQVEIRYPGINSQKQAMKFWDGGVTGMNNPAAAAVAEALADGRAADEIAVLSIGTGSDPKSNNPNHHSGENLRHSEENFLVDNALSSGPLKDIKRLAAAVVGDPPDFSSFLAHTMTGGIGPDGADTVAKNVVRLSPLIVGDFAAGEWKFPSWSTPGVSGRPNLFQRLVKMDLDVTSTAGVTDILALTAAWIGGKARNQPIRYNFFQDSVAGIHAEIGDLWYSEAVARAHVLGLA